jgi:hypothetical protein
LTGFAGSTGFVVLGQRGSLLDRAVVHIAHFSTVGYRIVVKGDSMHEPADESAVLEQPIPYLSRRLQSRRCPAVGYLSVERSVVFVREYALLRPEDFGDGYTLQSLNCGWLRVVFWGFDEHEELVEVTYLPG